MGLTQHDPLFEFMYMVGTLPLICLLCNPGLWYADNVSTGGSLLELYD